MRILAAAFIVASALPAGAADYPKIELSTKHLKMTVYPPDAEKGFYRGSRFCWGGVMGDVEIGGHRLFHAWKDKHDPTNHDDIIGPVLEFGQDSPLGYTEAKVGEPFVKIGVGELLKQKDEPYKFYTNYKVADPGLWKVKRTVKRDEDDDDRIEFRHTLTTKTGYSYHLAIGVTLSDDRVESHLIVDYQLINTGSKKFVTDVYNHNFFNVDKQSIGPKYRIELEGAVQPTADSAFGDRAKIGQAIEFPKTLGKEAAFGRLVSADSKKPYADLFRLTYQESDKKWVKVSVYDHWGPNWEEKRRKKFQIWAIGSVMCPEPFYEIALEPGEAVKWWSRYVFWTD